MPKIKSFDKFKIIKGSLNNYISITGLAPIKLYELMNENLDKNLESFIAPLSIPKFELQNHMEILQAVKLLQTVIVEEEELILFKPLELEGTNKEKYKIIRAFTLEPSKGTNISKTLTEVFDMYNEVDYKKPWVEFYELIYKSKITPVLLMEINQVTEDYLINDELTNCALERTLSVCDKFNRNYFKRCASTFKNLKIQSSEDANKFFDGSLFINEELENEYLSELEKELENL